MKEAPQSPDTRGDTASLQHGRGLTRPRWHQPGASSLQNREQLVSVTFKPPSIWDCYSSLNRQQRCHVAA